MAPYTNPNTNIHWYDPNPAVYYDVQNAAKRMAQDVPTGLSFYNIHWETTPGLGAGQIEVTVRYDGPGPPPGGWPVPADMVWNGDVQLTSDVWVPSGQTLVTAGGSRIVSSARRDVGAAGADPNQVEILVDGTLQVDGAVTPVTFTSSRDPSFTHRLAKFGADLTESPAAAPGDWYGIRATAVSAVSGTGGLLQYATGAINYAVSVFPDLLGQPANPFTVSNNLLDVTFDRDVEVQSPRVIPAGWKVGLSVLDTQDLNGIDPARVEVILRGDLGGTLTLESGAVLQSASPVPTETDWYGIRTANLASLIGNGGTISDARAAVAYENSDWPPTYTSLKTGLTLAGNYCDFSKDRDYTVSSGTLAIPSGWTVGFTSLRDVSGAGEDGTRSELILAGGQLDLDGVLRSDDPSEPGGWYGVRTDDLDDVIGSGLSAGGSLEDAGGAISLEGAAAAADALGDPAFFSRFSGKLSFANNRSDVCFDRDIVVASGTTWTVPAGWRIGFTANKDASGGGADGDLAELRVDGVLMAGDVAGATGGFTSNEPSSLASLASWYGIRHLEPYHIGSTGYGYNNTPLSDSSIENVEIQGAQIPISVETLAAPQIRDVQFLDTGGNPGNPIHIYLNATDVVVPFERSWSLTAGTYVVATNASSNDYNVSGAQFGEPGLVDLIVQGALVTAGTAADRVRIRAETRTPACNNWGGIFLDRTSDGSVLDYARVTHALNPVFFYYPSANQELTNSQVDFFGEVGVWALEAKGAGVTISNSRIVRQASQAAGTGSGGCLLLEKCASGVVQADTVIVNGTNLGTLGAGVRIKDTVHWCLPMPAAAETLRVADNVLQGPGETLDPLLKWSGLVLDEACRQGARWIEVKGNRFVGGAASAGWPTDAIFLKQSAGARFDCNYVANSRRVLRSFNNGTPIGAAIKAVGNHLRGSLLNTGPSMIVVGHGGAGAGGGAASVVFDKENTFVRALYAYPGPGLAPQKFLSEEDEVNPLYVLDAKNNTWATPYSEGNALADSVLLNLFDIESHINGDVDVGSFLSTPEDCATSGIVGRAHSGVQSSHEWVGEHAISEVRLVAEDGLTTELTTLSPSPFRKAVRVRFSLAERSEQFVSLDVFGVSGNRVATLVSEPLDAGIYEVTWSGRGVSGRTVAPGVYFVRLRAGDRAVTKKVVRLR